MFRLAECCTLIQKIGVKFQLHSTLAYGVFGNIFFNY